MDARGRKRGDGFWTGSRAVRRDLYLLVLRGAHSESHCTLVCEQELWQSSRRLLLDQELVAQMKYQTVASGAGSRAAGAVCRRAIT